MAAEQREEIEVTRDQVVVPVTLEHLLIFPHALLSLAAAVVAGVTPAQLVHQVAAWKHRPVALVRAEVVVGELRLLAVLLVTTMAAPLEPPVPLVRVELAVQVGTLAVAAVAAAGMAAVAAVATTTTAVQMVEVVEVDLLTPTPTSRRMSTMQLVLSQGTGVF
jgi:hypothetical protein